MQFDDAPRRRTAHTQTAQCTLGDYSTTHIRKNNFIIILHNRNKRRRKNLTESCVSPKIFQKFFFRAPVTTEHAAHRLCKGQRGTLEKKIIYQRTTLCVPTANFKCANLFSPTAAQYVKHTLVSLTIN